MTSVALKTVGYLREVRAELRKITWPSVAELKELTKTIVIQVILIGVLIGLMDLAFSKILIDFLGRLFG